MLRSQIFWWGNIGCVTLCQTRRGGPKTHSKNAIPKTHSKRKKRIPEMQKRVPKMQKHIPEMQNHILEIEKRIPKMQKRVGEHWVPSPQMTPPERPRRPSALRNGREPGPGGDRGGGTCVAGSMASVAGGK